MESIEHRYEPIEMQQLNEHSYSKLQESEDETKDNSKDW